MKTIILIIIPVAVLGLIFFYLTNIYGWMEFRSNTDTPEQFLNKTTVSRLQYEKDKALVASELKTLLLQHRGFFESSAYFEGTDIIIDTIVYSPDLGKVGILFLTKNPESLQPMPDKNEKYYYDATSYLGTRQQDTFELSWLGPNFSNSHSISDISEDIRTTCFRRFVTKDTTGMYAQKYNLNDLRFWTSDEWRRIEEGKIKAKEFEEMKLKHPENIYEPPKRK